MTRGYVPGETFHTSIRRVYDGKPGWAVNKRHERMAKVVYEAVHENVAETEPARRGHGKDYATWIFAEEPGLAEGHFESGFELMIDAALEPNAAIGLHMHDHTEEVYYILAGEVTMTTVAADGREHTERLGPGDAHLVKIGQGHFGTAGPQGVRFLAVAMRKA